MATLSGFLGKKGDTGIVRAWKIRYFELKLTPSPILTFAESRDAAVEGSIDLSKVTSIQVNDEILGKRRGDGSRGFQIDVPGHSFQLMATNDEELNHWLNGLAPYVAPGAIRRDMPEKSSSPALSSTPSLISTGSTPLKSPRSPQTPFDSTVTRRESLARPSTNPFDNITSGPSLTSQTISSSEAEAEIKTLKEQVSALQAQLKAAQGEITSLKEQKSAEASSSTAASSTPQTSTSAVPEASEADVGDLAELMKLRDEVLAAMTELRVQGLGAARAMQAARAYRAEVESLKAQLAQASNTTETSSEGSRRVESVEHTGSGRRVSNGRSQAQSPVSSTNPFA